MDYAGLQAEIAKPAYSGMDDPTIAAALTAQSVTVYNDVPVGNVVGYLALQGKLSGIIGYAGIDPTTKMICSMFATLCSTPSVTMFQCSDPATRTGIVGFINTFATASLISADDVTALTALMSSSTSIAAQLDFGPHCDMEQEILAARRWGD